MRTTFFLFAMLANVVANAAVTVTPLSTDYATKKVTFKVAWTNSPTAPYNNRVWIWIDFCPISGVTPQSFSTATITSPVKTGGNGTITNATARGFFIEYNTTNAGTTVTATLSNAPTGKFNWCVYGSDYPPNVTLDEGTYTFNGTTDFIVSSHAQPITNKTITRTSLTVNSTSTFTDATGYPGIGQLYCPYTGSDLIMDATHLCQQRTSGAKNWEAYIKDSRDNQIYRITQFSDGSWWFADDFNIDLKVKNTCNGKRYYSINDYPACPAGWAIPTVTQIKNRWACPPNNDTYGGSIVVGGAPQQNDCGPLVDRWDVLATGCGTTPPSCCTGNTDCHSWKCNLLNDIRGRMRCLRQL